MKRNDLSIMFWSKSCSFIHITDRDRGVLTKDKQSKIFHVIPVIEKDLISCCVDIDCHNDRLDLKRGSIIELQKLFNGTKREIETISKNFDDKELLLLRYVYDNIDSMQKIELLNIEQILATRMTAKCNIRETEIELDKIITEKQLGN